MAEPWVCLESNPDTLNQVAHSLGCPQFIGFSDCYGLSEELLQGLPQPVLGFVLLFPLHAQHLLREFGEQSAHPEISPRLYFLRQHVRNACGSIAVAHLVLNNLAAEKLSLEPDAAFAQFYARTRTLSPDEAGNELGRFEAFAVAHQAAAMQGQTRPHDAAQTESHFICFVEMDGHIYELDGTKPCPVNHGRTTPTTFAVDVGKIIQTNFIDRLPGEPNFSVLSFGLLDEAEPLDWEPPEPVHPDADAYPTSEPPGDRSWAVSPGDVEQIVEMGFDPNTARQALEVTRGDVTQAINFLLSG
eukprot:TRINITY_DN26184_c0_g1_i1.p1 TRINITY_DN26184_c0_g1~~TRINITY_DN26184_c0_g1_i1.p1  ORF type:complete len:310 (+),score=40.48 TRINITY_DN26184_c0_g1_i1:28-930(+)